MTSTTANSCWVLLIRCKDVPGIIHAVSGFLAKNGFFICRSAQYGEDATGWFFMRVVFTTSDSVTSPDLVALRTAFAAVAAEFGMAFRIEDLKRKQRTLILASKESHCVHDLLYRMDAGLLPASCEAVISNHELLRKAVERYELPFYYMPVTHLNRREQEEAILEQVKERQIDLVILAKYMQILTPFLVERLEGKAINIHHSFLPSFKGGRPYHQAYEKGVKIIGATSHFVSDDLDEGPIIEQEVTRVDKPRGPNDLACAGRDVEARVLSDAVRYYLEYRIIRHGNRTVVFR